MKRNITAELEALIDATSLLHVLTTLERICDEKAEHLRVNWQDNVAAKVWDKASRVCGRPGEGRVLYHIKNFAAPRARARTSTKEIPTR